MTTTDQLAAIEARANDPFGTMKAGIGQVDADRDDLLAMLREQGAVIERVKELADTFDGRGSHASYHGTEAEMETWLSAANHLRAALTPRLLAPARPHREEHRMSGMAEVLAAHWSRSTHADSEPAVDKCDGCGAVIYTCGNDPTPGGIEPLAAHQAAMLSAAGFGDVAEAKAQALEEAADDYRHYETPNARLYLRARAAAVRGEA